MNSSYLDYFVLKDIAEDTIRNNDGDPNSPESDSVYGRMIEHSKEDGFISQSNFEYILSAVQKAAGNDAGHHIDHYEPSFSAHGLASSIAVKVYASDGIVCGSEDCGNEAIQTLTIQGEGKHDFCYRCALNFRSEYRRKTERGERNPVQVEDLHREFTPAFICAAELLDSLRAEGILDEHRLQELEDEHFSQAFEGAVEEVQGNYPDDTYEEETLLARMVREDDEYRILYEYYALFSHLPKGKLAKLYQSYRNVHFNSRARARLSAKA